MQACHITFFFCSLCQQVHHWVPTQNNVVFPAAPTACKLHVAHPLTSYMLVLSQDICLINVLAVVIIIIEVDVDVEDFLKKCLPWVVFAFKSCYNLNIKFIFISVLTTALWPQMPISLLAALRELLFVYCGCVSICLEQLSLLNIESWWQKLLLTFEWRKTYLFAAKDSWHKSWKKSSEL